MIQNTALKICLAHSEVDNELASQLSEILKKLGHSVISKPEESDLLIVLVGGAGAASQTETALDGATPNWSDHRPRTRYDRAVDSAIASALHTEVVAPRPGLLGVLLPHHPSHDKPYYDPELVPMRLHDNIEAGYAPIMHRWDELEALPTWLAEADARRRVRLPWLKYSTFLALQDFPWDDAAPVNAPTFP